MALDDSLSKEDAFVDAVYSTASSPSTERPLVTLTWAQTLDFKIASAPGSPRLMISGRESMGVTMRIRCLHDTILVGIQTLLDDDPRLMVRDLPTSKIRHPRPVIVDPLLMTPLDSRLMQNVQARISPAPFVVASSSALADDEAARHRCEKLIDAGVSVLLAQQDANGRIDLRDMLRLLKKEGVERLMVEGGARIIASFLSMPDLVDRVVITTGPVFAPPGSRGPVLLNHVNLECLRTEVFGHDTVTTCTIE